MSEIPRTVHLIRYDTARGSLTGVEHRNFEGVPVLRRLTRVPYAAPPVGRLRWRRPQPLPATFRFDSEPGSSPNCTAFGPICPQPRYGTDAAYVYCPLAATPILNVQHEDCLYLNIWLPAIDAPPEGWPVQFHIHGGWLQVGNANQSHDQDPFDLLQETTPRIIVAPTYRLGVFGFLGGEDLAAVGEDPAPGNYGLWDQRCALEWTAKHIALFGGDPGNITVGGLSAGANSAFFQLNYDTLLPPSERLIRRIYLWSNAVAIQPSATTSAAPTSQFEDLCDALRIPQDLSPAATLERLRATSSERLVAAVQRMEYHTFRPTTDNDFIPSSFLSSLHSGEFTTRLHDGGISVLLGEVSDEKELYKIAFAPDSPATLETQLQNYYPKHVCDALMPLYTIPQFDTVRDTPNAYAEVFSQIVADMQVHAAQRGLTHVLLNPPKSRGIKALPKSSVHRYRISWRAKGLDCWMRPELGVFHSADQPIWWASGWRMGFTPIDRRRVKRFLKGFDQFLNGDRVEWGTSEREDTCFWLSSRGCLLEDIDDPLWERGLQIWEAAWTAQKDLVAAGETPAPSARRPTARLS